MTLIASISGIRGTIGSRTEDGLNPITIVRYAVAYAFWLRGRCGRRKGRVVIGRDARISGQMVSQAVAAALQGGGLDVLDLGLATTPTVEMAVPMLEAQGGVIITASHNGREWNALKLLNEYGEFVSASDGKSILQFAESNEHIFPSVDQLGTYQRVDNMLQQHIDAILALPYVDVEAIRAKKFSVAIDPVNSVGSLALPALLSRLGVEHYIAINLELSGDFAHNPEPLPKHLGELSKTVVESQCHVGFAVDPDVDRLVIVCEDGSFFGEEYTLVACADWVLSRKVGNTVSNLSSTSALRDLTIMRGGAYYSSAVGEVNVVARMKEVAAIIGGEGNGGVILPELHYGRDALVGIALFLTHLAKSDVTPRELRARFPNYAMSKNRIELQQGANLDSVLESVKKMFQNERQDTTDGLRIEMKGGWVHLRKSNTEPIIRVYAEAGSQEQADELAQVMVDSVYELL